MNDLKRNLSSKETIAFHQKQTIISHERELEKQLNAKRQFECELLEAKKQLWSLKELGPRDIPSNLTRLLIDGTYPYLSENIKRILSGNKVTADICRLRGWDFFVDFDFRRKVQHPTQFGILMSMMIRNSFSRFRHLQPRLPTFHRLFRELPEHMKFLYEQSRKCAIMHNLSVFFTNKLTNGNLTRQYSLMIQRRVLPKLAKKLSLGLEDFWNFKNFRN
jgi:hypothetical protein